MESEQVKLIKELTQGKELAEQLKTHLNPSVPHETRQFLVKEILSSYDKALFILNCCAFFEETTKHSILESPCPWPSSKSEDHCFKDNSKKRKGMPRWTEQVRVSAAPGFEAPATDGYSWRKYGQKDILGANFPRAYFRCTHRHSQGCLATKQVQRSDTDPTSLEITYKGRHSCVQTSHHISKNGEPKPKRHRFEEPKVEKHNLKPSQQEIMYNFGKDLRVKTEELNSALSGANIFPSFSFQNSTNNIFSENDLIGGFSSLESNYFSNFELGKSSESDLSDIISAPTSVTNSPIGPFEFSFDEMNFDMSFPLETLEFN